MPTLTDDSIQTSSAGFVFPASETWTFAPGIMVSSIFHAGVLCDYNGAALINHGTIISAMPSPTAGYGRGVWVTANDVAITNAADGLILGYAFGMLLNGPGVTITNQGQIESFGFAINCSSTVIELDIDNAGVIRGRDFGIDPLNASGTIHNSGLIEGTRSVAIDGNFQSHAVLSIVNEASGIIRGGDRAISQISYEGLSLRNRGTIVGEIYLDTDGGNFIRNSGVIAGKIVLGDGADIFEGNLGKSGAVFGKGGNDTLAGGNTADRLDGGYGNDILTGRGGKDQFVFSTDVTNTPNVDTIRGFAVNIDKIVLDTDIFHLGLPGVLAAARFHIGPSAGDASDRIIYNPGTGALFYDPDGRGGDAQVKMAQLAKHLALDHADFLVIT